MNGFIIILLSLMLDNIYFDISIDAKYYQQHIDIQSDAVEVIIDADIRAYLEHEIGLDDIDIIFDDTKSISDTLLLDIESNYNFEEVAFISSSIVYNNIEYIQSYDSATLTMDYSIFSAAYTRENELTASGRVDNRVISFYIEKAFSLPYMATFDTAYSGFVLTKEIRGYSHEEIYQEGYNDGYNDGQEEGYFNGYFEGFEEGEYNGSMTQPIFKLFNAVFRVIDNILSVEILPGIKIWYILGVPFVFLIIQFFINLWR